MSLTMIKISQLNSGAFLNYVLTTLIFTLKNNVPNLFLPQNALTELFY